MKTNGVNDTVRVAMGRARPALACVILVLWALLPLLLYAATFRATLDRSNIAVGESALLSLTFEGGTPASVPALQAPNVSIQPLGQSQEFTVVNGRTSSSISYRFQVTPSRPGDYVIPAIEVEVDNKKLRSQPLTLHVSKSSEPVGTAFLKLIPSKDTVYVGEMFSVEIQLYLAVRQDSLQMPQIEGDGFIFGKPPQPTQSGAQVGNQMFNVITFRMSAVAVKSGKLNLGPAQCSLVLHMPFNSRRSAFDELFGGGAQRKPVTLSSDPIAISVLPLPKENQPQGFNGAVGSFSLAASASPTNVTAGDPITLRLQVTGQGNLESLPFPGGDDWPDFKLYPPSAKTETTDPLGLSGVKTFERVVIPQKADIAALPGLRFSFFDPEQKTYRTIDNPPIPITVRPSSVGQPQPTVLANSKQAEEAQAAPHDIVHIKPFIGTVTHLAPPLIMRPWFLILQLAPLLTWLSALVWRRRRNNLDNNPRLRRQAMVAATIHRGLKELDRLAETQDAESFFALVFRLVQEQLGERLELPASAITEAVLDERLRGRAPEELLTQVHEVFQLCNQARYAPQRSTQELKQIVPRVETALSRLRELPQGKAAAVVHAS